MRIKNGTRVRLTAHVVDGVADENTGEPTFAARIGDEGVVVGRDARRWYLVRIGEKTLSLARSSFEVKQYRVEEVRNDYTGSQAYGRLEWFRLFDQETGRQVAACKPTERDLARLFRDYPIPREERMRVRAILAEEERAIKEAPADVYTVEPGRHIYRNGRPFISLNCCQGTPYVEADSVCHVIAAALSQAQPQADDWKRS